ncbi:hypothetical protein AB1L88_23960 [Tautonia sp. JC769]|uniref:hypothetical protein n=1 Tax=Tautonia sp. JC769 TaxID=3232135 RepID=UPI003457DDEA
MARSQASFPDEPRSLRIEAEHVLIDAEAGGGQLSYRGRPASGEHRLASPNHIAIDLPADDSFTVDTATGDPVEIALPGVSAQTGLADPGRSATVVGDSPSYTLRLDGPASIGPLAPTTPGTRRANADGH